MHSVVSSSQHGIVVVISLLLSSRRASSCFLPITSFCLSPIGKQRPQRALLPISGWALVVFRTQKTHEWSLQHCLAEYSEPTLPKAYERHRVTAFTAIFIVTGSIGLKLCCRAQHSQFDRRHRDPGSSMQIRHAADELRCAVTDPPSDAGLGSVRSELSRLPVCIGIDGAQARLSAGPGEVSHAQRQGSQRSRSRSRSATA